MKQITFRRPAQVSGYLDEVTGSYIRGWCANNEGVSAARLDIYIDRTLVSTVTGTAFRGDLKEANIARGFAGFSVEIPKAYRDGKRHVVKAYIHGSSKEISGSPKSFQSDFVISGTKMAEFYLGHLSATKQNTETLGSLRNRLKNCGEDKIAFVCGFSNDFKPLPHTSLLIDSLKTHGYFTFYVHTSQKDQAQVDDTVRSSAHVTLLRQNIGYDFGSWLSCFAILRDIDIQPNEVLLANDSVLGPVKSLESVLAPELMSTYDVFGLLDSYEIKYHLQSYFLRISARALTAGLVDEFSAQYSLAQEKSRIVLEGEVGIFNVARELGLETGSYISYENVRDRWLKNVTRYRSEMMRFALKTTDSSVILDQIESKFDEIERSAWSGQPLNATHFFWRTLLEDFDFPFVKRDFLLSNPASIPDWHLVGNVLGGINEGALDFIKQMRLEQKCRVPVEPLDEQTVSET